MPSRPTTRTGRDEGFTLVEVLVAAVILGILATSVLGIVVQTQSANVDSRSRTAAASLAARELDLVRERFTSSTTAPLDIADEGVVVNQHPLAGQVAGQPLRIDGQSYTVTRSAAWNATGSGASACEGGALVNHPTLQVTVAVTWPNMGSTKPVVSQLQIAPPKGTGLTGAQSYVAVKVVDSTGAPNAGRTVRVSNGAGSRTAMTDDTGCAVAQVTPPSAGASYDATLMDGGHVDITGAPNPTKSTGVVLPGQLNTAVTFTYDRAATLRLRIVEPDGTPYTGPVTGALTLVATEASGASSARSVPATSGVTVVAPLWPTRYGAYYGASAPPAGYGTVRLVPGATADLDVVLEMGVGSVVGLPPGADRVIASPGECTAPGAQDVPADRFTLVPGTWSFYAAGPAFDCGTGPSAVPITGGENGDVYFEPSELRVNGAPPEGRLWATSLSRASALTTCPDPSLAQHAIDVDGARTGSVALPAGDWYVYRTAGGPDAACLGVPAGAFPQNVAYGATSTIAWRESQSSVALRVTYSSQGWAASDQLIVSTQQLGTCRTTLPAGATPLARTATEATGVVAPGRLYLYRFQPSASGNRCTAAVGNPFTVPDTSPTATIVYGRAGVTTP
ncbi:type IV pilus modification PilV family protein [Cellulomonas iranensis]|uniref:type IV pilus modification PilV family protein n=1 Tax=Cellulomonas iranensis TaxID=76862 RepID=UPI003D7D5668